MTLLLDDAQRKYQQWQCSNPDYAIRYLVFVERIAKDFNVSVEFTLTELQRTRWFKWND